MLSDDPDYLPKDYTKALLWEAANRINVYTTEERY